LHFHTYVTLRCHDDDDDDDDDADDDDDDIAFLNLYNFPL